jgi:geranylgeranyl pyrophosphate synthase
VTKFTIDDYYNSIHAKSAYYSVYGPMQCGAIIAGASQKQVEGIKKYGTLAGNAFQIKDDILDCISTEAELGKSIGNDVREGVKTVILWHAIQNADSATLNRLKEIYRKPRESKSDADVKFVLDKFNDLGSIAFAEEEAERMSVEAISLFETESKDIKESGIKQIARDAIAHTARRQK